MDHYYAIMIIILCFHVAIKNTLNLDSYGVYNFPLDTHIISVTHVGSP